MKTNTGIIAWFARNGVAANLLMAVILIAGLISVFTIKKEIFPEFTIDAMSVYVPYLGGTPEEVEEGVVVKIEEAIQDIPGIKKITSQSREGMGVVTVEILNGYDIETVLNKVKVRVDGISTFPAEAERPTIEEFTFRGEVMWVSLAGDLNELDLKQLADQVRDELVSIPGISQAEIHGTRRFEISIEVSEARLREYGLSFSDVSRAVRNSSINLPAGSIRTAGGEILLRTDGQAYTGEEYSNLVLRTLPDGTRILLGDVANVIDGFQDTTSLLRFNGKRSAAIQVLRVGDQSALDIAEKVWKYVEDKNQDLPPGVELAVWAESAKYLKERLFMLVRNGLAGLVLVFLSLTLFLRLRLAFWVCLGIPISFLGTFWIMPMPFFDASINMITLFAFILVLGIVVDDAIVVGENVYTTCRKYGFGIESAVRGTQEVAVPVTYGVLTTVAAFIPLMIMPGIQGKIWGSIGIIVISTLLFSLLESKLILPNHLSTLHQREQDESKLSLFERFQRMFGNGLAWWIDRVYRPVLRNATEYRWATICGFVGVLIVVVGFLASGHLRFVAFPNIESDFLQVNLEMAEGTPGTFTNEVSRRMEKALSDIDQESFDNTGERLVKHVLTVVGSDTNLFFVAELSPSEERSVPASEVANRWRDRIGPIPGAVSINYNSSIAESGRPIDVQLASNDFEQLRLASRELKLRLDDYAGVFDVSDTAGEGKQEVRLSIKPGAESLGLTLSDLARQVRQGFYGEEAQRIQRGRDDVRVMVRYPENERRSLGYLESMRVRAPNGAEVPFSYVAEAELDRGYSTIRRVDRKRVINVTADIDKATVSPDVVRTDITDRILPEILANHSNVSFSLEGEAREQREVTESLGAGAILAIFVIYALMAIPLKSYVQPLIIMSAIPFGLVGAVIGHVLMGIPVSMLSLMGMIALAGVAVNDSLVMIDFVNRARKEGLSMVEAVRSSGVARFRAILLTSLTTFAGLSPLLMERSLQAQILIPMATSLAFGVIFATAITLLLIPCLYLAVDDLRLLFGRFWRWMGFAQSSGTPSTAG